jgi:hypothetical protein
MTIRSRRAILAGASVLATVAAVAPIAARKAATASDDAELRRLWSEYLKHADAYAAAREKYEPVRAAFDAELPPCPNGVVPGTHLHAHAWLWHKHGLDTLCEAWYAPDFAMREMIPTILHTEAEGLYGIGVKLAALPNHFDTEDLDDAIAAVLGDIDRLLGSDFAEAVQVQSCPGDDADDGDDHAAVQS